jgi:DDE superfamily endonuclease/Tc5 transposase DNA-binding domain/CENP-B N-terminal DNA-binding domain
MEIVFFAHFSPPLYSSLVQGSHTFSLQSAMAQRGIKRKPLSLTEKVDIIRDIENGTKQSKVMQDRQLAQSTVCTIWKDREKLKTSFNSIAGPTKKLKSKIIVELFHFIHFYSIIKFVMFNLVSVHSASKFPEIEEEVLKWLKVANAKNIPVDGPTIKAKANELAHQMNVSNFTAGNGWLQRIKIRCGVLWKFKSGESNSADTTGAEAWLKCEWPILCKRYTPDDIFNADECGLFFKMTPDKTMTLKGQECKGGKKSKVRITILLCANMTGTSKLVPLVIGKSKNPRCFKGKKSFPVKYDFNSKSWMTTAIFWKWLREWDNVLIKQKRKILLIVDNCSAHKSPKNLRQIELAFLPPNVTSIIQPLDQGIIKNFKVKYRTLLVRHLLDNFDKGKSFDPTLWDSVEWTSKAWAGVTPETIRNCFRHSGFVELDSSQTDEEICDHTHLICSIPIAIYTEIMRRGLADKGTSASDLVDLDDQLQVCEDESNLEDDSVDEDDDDAEMENMEPDSVPITVDDAIKCMSIITDFATQSENCPQNVHDAYITYNNWLQSIRDEKPKTQTIITNYYYTV